MTRDTMVSAAQVRAFLLARREAILRCWAPDRVQPHSRRMPTDVELASAQFAARQFVAAADDLAAGLLVDGPQDRKGDCPPAGAPQRSGGNSTEDVAADAATQEGES